LTGSTQTAWQIQEILAQRRGPIIPFIAETGGQNAMIVDATALPEQVVKDVLVSAFQSAGQRCSALRLLLLQEDLAPKVLPMLAGAMAQLSVGDPRLLSTDVGPVIDGTAQEALNQHISILKGQGGLIHCTPVRDHFEQGTFVTPCAYALDFDNQAHWDLLKEEHFGPILHVMTFPGGALEQVIQKINNLGFGLTFGLHTRIQERMDYTANHIQAGNIYVNRNIIGAVVGVQPFGGQGLSGTGPKAGGPFYLQRFVHEHMVTVNTTAQGGNATLMVLEDE
jgi:RHH-type proline utilization regulon transcriptional repressor/proline dehydrogenase/delta 1-pyrroline-5-carboxylate dehydrogenase